MKKDCCKDYSVIISYTFLARFKVQIRAPSAPIMIVKTGSDAIREAFEELRKGIYEVFFECDCAARDVNFGIVFYRPDMKIRQVKICGDRIRPPWGRRITAPKTFRGKR